MAFLHAVVQEQPNSDACRLRAYLTRRGINSPRLCVPIRKDRPFLFAVRKRSNENGLIAVAKSNLTKGAPAIGNVRLGAPTSCQLRIS